MSAPYELKESPIRNITSSSQLAFRFSTTDWGGTPTGVQVSAKNLTTGFDVTAQILTGSAGVDEDDIITPLIGPFQKNNMYQVLFQFVCAGNTIETALRFIIGSV